MFKAPYSRLDVFPTHARVMTWWRKRFEFILWTATYSGSLEREFVRKRGRASASVSSSECRTRVYARSKSWRLTVGCFLPFFLPSFLPSVIRSFLRSSVRSASLSLPGRSLVLFRSVNVTATYSLTVEQGSMPRLGFGANIWPRVDARARQALEKSRRKADFSYREIGSSVRTPGRDSITRLERQASTLFPRHPRHQRAPARCVFAVEFRSCCFVVNAKQKGNILGEA